MPPLEIRGIQVDFPFQPYASQLVYMEKVIESLQTKQNALLESPTGTGKTLCLLCATLAWRETLTTKVQSTNPAAAKISIGYDDIAVQQDSSENPTTQELPKIIYASRTHSQLKQVIKELKNTSYNPKITVLGSREQLCIHERVSKQTGSAQNHACRALVASRGCKFKRNFTDTSSSKTKSFGQMNKLPIMDIEELVQMGLEKETCPFYFSRDMQASAHIIFLPYNYLIDSSVRNSLGISVENNVLIFDEAHNIESVASDASSFNLTSSDVASAILELDECYKELSAVESTEEELSPQAILQLKELLLEIEKKLDNFQWPSETLGLTKPGDFIYEFLAQFNVTFETCKILVTFLESAIQKLSDSIGKNPKTFKLEHIVACFKRIFRSVKDYKERAKSFRVHIHEEVSKPNGNQNRRKSFFTQSSHSKPIRVLSYWCFSPGVAMSDLGELRPYNTILTSGTLSPLESTARELIVKFPIRLENSHVIDAEQIWVGVVGTGVTGQKLNSSFKFRDSQDYVVELGNTIVNFARIVPNGLLVFFPSYGVMSDSINKWKLSVNGKPSLWSRICNYKTPFEEPRGSFDFKSMVSDFENCINTTKNGAVFFAVCRGKVSEGIDFSDQRGRAVVITGLPFAPTKDPRVILKRQYLDGAPHLAGIKKLSGNDWYMQQASRAVNQAIGRVIRHRNDYGAIIFCDERFSSSQNQSNLSRWLQPYIRICKSYGEANIGLIQFFKRNNQSISKKIELDCSNVNKLKRNKEMMMIGKAPKNDVVMSGFKKVRRLNDEDEKPFVYSQGPSNGQSYIDPNLLQSQENEPTENIFKKKTLTTKTKPEFTSLQSIFHQSKEITIHSTLHQRNLRKTSTRSTGQQPSILDKYTLSFSSGNRNPKGLNCQVGHDEDEKVALRFLRKAKCTFSTEDFQHLKSLLQETDKDVPKIFSLLQISGELENLRADLIPLLDKTQLECFNNLSNHHFVHHVEAQENTTKILTKIQHQKMMMNLKKRKLEGKVPELLNPQCLICLGNAKEPQAAPCGHICCTVCWNKALMKVSCCPACRKSIDRQKLKSIKAVQDPKRFRCDEDDKKKNDIILLEDNGQ